MTKNIVLILTLAPLLMGCEGLGDLSQENITADEKLSTVPLNLVVSNVSKNVVIPTVNELDQDAQNLSQAVDLYCTDLGNKETLSTAELQNLRLNAQASWKKMMATFHRYELMQYGPVASDFSTTMQSLYTFDLGNKCRVETLVSRNRTPDLSPSTEEGYKLIGLDVFEHVLFTDGEKSLCPQVRPNSWFTRTSLLERQRNFCRYLQNIAPGLTAKTKKLKQDWAPNGGDFTGQIIVDNTLGPITAAVSSISQSLYFLYGDISDLKIATPAGIRLFNNRVSEARGCGEPCPNKAEHIPSGFSIDSLVAGLEGFSLLFNGIHPTTSVNGLSFDDLIAAQGHPEIVTRLNAALTKAVANLKKLRGQTTVQELAQAVDPAQCKLTTSSNRLAELCAIKADVRQVTDLLLQGEAVLSGLLTRPTVQQGDND